ncbi:hypothetical protein G9A89_016419 [Geosiphon pyriformis]|nr:hypothetical protein G9A89_016419 [Geosiphon pyriformis]
MDSIKEFIAAKDYASLVSFCEDLEFNLALTPNNNIPLEDLYSPYIAGFLVQNELIDKDLEHKPLFSNSPAARFLWKRIPERVKSSSEELKAVWSVGTALWKRDFANVYGLIETRQWKPLIAPLMTSLAEILRERMLNLLTEAYSSIGTDEVSRYLGLPHDRLLPILVEIGWIHDVSTDTLHPNKIGMFSKKIASIQQRTFRDRTEHIPDEFISTYRFGNRVRKVLTLRCQLLFFLLAIKCCASVDLEHVRLALKKLKMSQHPCMNFRQTLKYVTFVIHIPDLTDEMVKVDFQNEKTSIKITKTNSCASYISITHSQISPNASRYSISSANLVIILRKQESAMEWQKLSARFQSDEDNSDQATNQERWFLTRENVEKCNDLVQEGSRWASSQTVNSPKITSMRAFHDQDGILVKIDIKRPPISDSSIG